MSELGDLLSKLPAVTPGEIATAYAGRELYNKLVAPTMQMFGERGAKRIGEFLDKFRSKMPDPDNPLSGISDRILVPALNEIAVVEDETLQSLWAGLLRNAAISGEEKVRPSFIAILKQMSSDEAVLLKELREREINPPTSFTQRPYLSPEPEAEKLRRSICMDGLEAHLLVTRRYYEDGQFKSKLAPNYMQSTISVSVRGKAFLEACELPTASDVEQPQESVK